MSYFVAAKHYDPLIESGALVGDTPWLIKNRWQKFLAAGVEFDYKKEKRIYKVVKKPRFKKDERIVDFCQVPRSREEIVEHFGICSKYVRKYIEPLISDGSIIMTIPERPSSIEQRFVAADADAVVISEATVAGFCSEPRSRQDIAERFNLSAENARGYIKELVKAGIIKMTMPLNPKCKQQRFVNPSVEIDAFSAEALLDFCATPRSKEEIRERFGVSTKGAVSNFINPLLESGKLLRTIPEMPQHKWQRFVTA